MSTRCVRGLSAGCIIAVLGGSVVGDIVVLPREQRMLLAKLKVYETSIQLVDKELDGVLPALDSEFDEIRIQAIRVLLVHRLVARDITESCV